jgi:hypothetical protein
MKNPSFTKCDTITHEMQVNLNVFGALMLNWVA